MRAFEKIKNGLNEAIAYEKGTIKAKTVAITVIPVNTFRPEEIRSIRIETGLTQAVFAKYLGVSVKTVEAWEAGRNHPDGAACRLLALTQSDPGFPLKSGIVVR